MVNPEPHLLGEPRLVNPEVCRQAPDPTQYPLGQTPLVIYQTRLREAFLGMSGDLTENSVFDGPGQTPPLEHLTQILGWTSASVGQ